MRSEEVQGQIELRLFRANEIVEKDNAVVERRESFVKRLEDRILTGEGE